MKPAIEPVIRILPSPLLAHVACDLVDEIKRAGHIGIDDEADVVPILIEEALAEPAARIGEQSGDRPSADRGDRARRRPRWSKDRLARPSTFRLRGAVGRLRFRSLARWQRSADRSRASAQSRASSRPMPVERRSRRQACVRYQAWATPSVMTGGFGHAGLEHHLDAAVLLVAERLVELRALVRAGRRG